MSQTALAAPRLDLPGQLANPLPLCLNMHWLVTRAREERHHGVPQC